MKSVQMMSIAALEKLLNNKKIKLTQLHSKRQRLSERLNNIDGKIAHIEHGPGRARRPVTSGARRTNGVGQAHVTLANNDGKSLRTYVIQVLKANSDGLTIGEVQEAVLKVGYKTNSANFKNTLYQCLYHNPATFALRKKKYYLTKAAAAASSTRKKATKV